MENTTTPSAWLAYRRVNPQAGLRLFCFPYAGGSASIFAAWPNQLPTHIEVCPVQLPGRETRIKEAPYKRLTMLVEALARELSPFLDKPFAFFGHSMGALISFELTRHLRRTGGPQPGHLFVSAARAPHTPDTEPPIHHLPEKEFIEALKAYNGTPEPVLQHEELMEIILPYLRADFEICETHTYQAEEPLPMPFTVLGGWEDKKIEANQLGAWRDLTSSTCTIKMFSGDHFFLLKYRQQILETISSQLSSII